MEGFFLFDSFSCSFDVFENAHELPTELFHSKEVLYIRHTQTVSILLALILFPLSLAPFLFLQETLLSFAFRFGKHSRPTLKDLWTMSTWKEYQRHPNDAEVNKSIDFESKLIELWHIF